MIDQLREVHEGKPWMGSSLKGKLARITEEEAFIRPLGNVHSIAEILSHLTFWRQEAILKIQSGKGSKTDDHPDNWPSNAQLRQQGWLALWATYETSLAALITLLETKDDSFLDEQYYDTDFKGHYPYRFLINGMLHHDIYHLGQLGLIIRLLREQAG